MNEDLLMARKQPPQFNPQTFLAKSAVEKPR